MLVKTLADPGIFSRDILRVADEFDAESVQLSPRKNARGRGGVFRKFL